MIAGSSFFAWWGCGRVFCHSFLEERDRVKITGRWAIKASHSRKIKNNRAVRDTIEPREETTFQQV